MFPVARFRVEDRSMLPTLAPGDYVLVNRWSYRLHRPMKGDLVVLRDPETRVPYLVKRVTDVANGSVFVAGDNVAETRKFGAVPRRLIVGRVFRTARP